MSQDNLSLKEPFRLLRETRLKEGFEERFAARLALEPRRNLRPIRRLGSPRKVALLLAAIALPAAALASSGWLLLSRSKAPVQASESRIEVQHESIIQNSHSNPSVPGASATAKSVETAIPPIAPESKPPVSPIERPRQREASQPRTERSTIPLGPNGTKGMASPKNDHVNSTVTHAVSPQSQARSSVSSRGIESLEISLPRHEEASPSIDRHHALTTERVERLRGASERNTEIDRNIRERAASRRDMAGERRGGESAQQARERVHARERKEQ